MGQVLNMEISWKTNLPLFSYGGLYVQTETDKGWCLCQLVGEEDEVQDTRKDCTEETGKKITCISDLDGASLPSGEFFFQFG